MVMVVFILVVVTAVFIVGVGNIDASRNAYLHLPRTSGMYKQESVGS